MCKKNNIMEHNLHSECHLGKKQPLKDYYTLKKNLPNNTNKLLS